MKNTLMVLCAVAGGMIGFAAARWEVETTIPLPDREIIPTPLSNDEIIRLGAVRAMDRYCNINVRWTNKTEEINERASAVWQGQPAQKAQIMKAAENFQNTNCRTLLEKFPDMMVYIND